MILNPLKVMTVVTALAVSATASADVLLTETFDYPVGALVTTGNPNGWVQSNHKDDAIQVTSTELSYPGFLTGKSIKLGSSTATAQDVARAVVPVSADGTVTPLTEGDIYLATLINVKNVEAKKYFFSTVSTNYTGKLEDGKAFTGDYNRVFAEPSDNEGKYKISFSKSTTTTTVLDREFDLNKTYLLVIHVGLVNGTNNDVFEAWVNPVTDATPAPDFVAQSGSDMSKGFVGVAVHQQANFSGACPDMLVGPIKVATTWAELFDGEGGGDTPNPNPDAEISASLSLPEGFYMMQYQTYPVTVNVKASNLTEDITVGNLGSFITASESVIPAAEAMSANGYDLTLTLKATGEAPISQTVSFTSGSVLKNLNVNVPVQPVSQMMGYRFGQAATDWTTYLASSTGTVTYVEPDGTFYVEDPTGGLKVSPEFIGKEAMTFKEGDKVKNLYLTAGEESFGVRTFYLMSYYGEKGVEIGTLLSNGNVKSPTTATLAAIKANPEDYINRLVQVADLTFDKAGETFSTSSTSVTEGETTGQLRAFAGSDLIGQTIPETATVTAISTSYSAAVLTVRHAADVVSDQPEKGLEIERTLLVDAAEYYPVGKDTPFAKFTVKATALESAVGIWIGGTDRAAFTTDIDEIPAGTGEYTVNVTFNATKVGRNSAMINFDASPVELSQSIAMAALAYDPDNMPVFTVDDDALTPFSTAVGTAQEQVITVDAKGLLDYGTVRVLGQGNGAFILGSAMFLKDGKTQIKVTFNPKSEGNYHETIEFTSPKAETVTVKVTGSTTGTKPGEDKQGDELVFDTSNPLAKYSTDFSNAGLTNKPLSLEGWKNVALDGTRAFWAYTTDGNTMAKVTAYDSQVATTDETPAEMLLLSPALDFAAESSHLLEFRIMGDFLTDDMTDQFSVLYIDPTLPEDERYQVIGGIDIPTGSDANGEWRQFVIDLDGLDIADTFFIGFHYLSTRGRNTTVTYYVDDFSWGSDETAFIRVDKTLGVTTGKVGESTKIDDFTVTGMNLTEPIAVGFEGAHKTHFTLSHQQLPAEGGTLTVNYTPQEEGDHGVYVTLKSANAPATYIQVNGSTILNAIGDVNVDPTEQTETIYYNLRGERIYRPEPGQLYIKVTGNTATKEIH